MSVLGRDLVVRAFTFDTTPGGWLLLVLLFFSEMIRCSAIISYVLVRTEDYNCVDCGVPSLINAVEDRVVRSAIITVAPLCV